MVLWFYNLFYIAKHVDLGLAHSIQHNQLARNYVIMSDGSELKEWVLNKAYHETIGAHAVLKPSDTIAISNNILSGSKNWFTNLTVADYIALNIIKPYNAHASEKIIVDLSKASYLIDTNFMELTGMKTACASNISIKEYLVPDTNILNEDKTANRSFFEECSFYTNLLGSISSLFDEVYEHAKKINKNKDYNVIKVKLDVFTSMNIWVSRMEQLANNINSTTSADWWLKKEYQYLFAKKTLLSVINLSRELCIQKHMIAEGEESRIFRNALVFATHMRKFDQLENLWDRPEDKEIDFDFFIDDNVNKIQQI